MPFPLGPSDCCPASTVLNVPSLAANGLMHHRDVNSTSTAARWRRLYLGALLALCAGMACGPSDPAPPLRLGQTGGEIVVRVDKDEAPEARIIVLEVIRNPSKVVSKSDERTWRVVGTQDKAVDQVTLGRTPPGWVEQMAWTPPDGKASLTVQVEFTDGRVFLIDAEDR